MQKEGSITSSVERRITTVKGNAENQGKIKNFLWWEPKGGTSTISYDNWTNTGPLILKPFNVQTCHH